MNIKHLQLIEDLGLNIQNAPKKLKENYSSFKQLNDLIETQKEELKYEDDRTKLEKKLSEVREAEDILETLDIEICQLVQKWDKNKEMYAERALKMQEGRTKKKNNDGGGAISKAKIVIPKDEKFESNFSDENDHPIFESNFPINSNEVQKIRKIGNVEQEEAQVIKKLDVVEDKIEQESEIKNELKDENIKLQNPETEEVNFVKPQELKPPAPTKKESKSSIGWYVIAGGIALVTFGAVILKKD